MFELVIFDCDGVLVDSETIACRIDAELLTAAGFPYTFEEIRREFVGVNTRRMCRQIEEQHGRSLPEDMHERMLEATLAAFEAELAAVEGVAAAISGLPMPRCVASSSDLARIRHSLKLTGLLAFFDPHLFSTQQVAHPKPAPDIFLFAAAQMGVAPHRCVVIEDSTPGVIAGRAAGMTVLGFHGAGHCLPGHGTQLLDAGAQQVFTHMHKLPDLIRSLAQPPQGA